MRRQQPATHQLSRAVNAIGISPPINTYRFELIESSVISNTGDGLNSADTGNWLVIGSSISNNGGDGVDIGPNSLRENARRAYSLYTSGYRLPVTPPSPPLSATGGPGRVTLDWSWKPGAPLPDPLSTWDDSSAFLSSLPDTHWRRADPPAGHVTGGRIFEGYRLWRSESPDYDPATFSLVRQYDVADDLGFAYDSGLEFAFTDSNLQRGKKYWYAVTSFIIPGVTVNVIPIPGAPRILPGSAPRSLPR